MMNSCCNDIKFSTLVELLRYRAQNQADKLAFKFLLNGETESVSLTYQELEHKAQAIAAYLQSITPAGERALLMYPSGLEFITAFFGCLYAGVVAVPLYPLKRNQKFSRLKAIVADAQATVALTTTSVLDNIGKRLTENPELASLRWLATDNIKSDLANNWQKPTLGTHTLAFLQYTSGSTGTPKGVMINHGNILHNERLIKIAFGNTADTVGVGWLPLFHDMGLIGNVIQPVYLGRTCILFSPVDFIRKPIRWLEAISRYRATTSGGPNFAYDLCVRKITSEQISSLDLSSWEVAFIGAETIRINTLRRFAAKFEPCGFQLEKFYPCYGMAETTLMVSGGLKTAAPIVRKVKKAALKKNRLELASGKQESQEIVGCGLTDWFDQKVIIADPNLLIQCPSNQVGEIWISGSSVACGYWNQEAKTEKTFNAYLANTKEGPFLRTGDLGFLQDGELFITGRLKDVIIIRGQNHYPQDIELTVEQSHPALRSNSGAAFSIRVKSSERLVIVQEVERSYLQKLKVAEILGDISQAVAAQHSLQVYAAVLVKPGSIPKTSSNKIQRHSCRDAFLTGSLKIVKDWSEDPQSKQEFKRLQTKIESVMQKLQNCK